MSDREQVIQAAVHRVLDGVLGQKDRTFSEFRFGMLDECPIYLTDEELHDLYEQATKDDDLEGWAKIRPSRFDRIPALDPAVSLNDAVEANKDQWKRDNARKIKNFQKAKAKQGKGKGKSKKKDWRDLTLGDIANKASKAMRRRSRVHA